MKIGFFTDPHLGCVRTAHTSPISRKRLTTHLYNKALECIDILDDEGAARIICLGDLFDTYSNTESVLLQGASVMGRVDYCLAGNHDISNDVNNVGSLQALRQLLNTVEHEEKVILGDSASVASAKAVIFGECNIVFAPHVMSQELFERALQEAAKLVKSSSLNILCLHCNVGESDGSSALFLTKQMQDYLLPMFDKIILGHEHVPRELQDGKIVVLGNTFPLSFGEIANRYCYMLDTSTGELRKVWKSFNTKFDYKSIDARELLSDESELELENSTASLFEITGSIDKAYQIDLIKSIAKLWRNNGAILMLKNNVMITGTDSKPVDVRQERRTLRELVSDAIDSTPYRAEYDEAVQAVLAEHPQD